MASRGRIYQRGPIYYLAYRWDGRESRESARSSDRVVAERLLARRVREREERGPTDRVTFDPLATWYLDDYVLRRLRTLDTARGRVANLRCFRRLGGAAHYDRSDPGLPTSAADDGRGAVTVNRETSALSRMFHLGVRAARLAQRPIFPERLDENGPRQGFFEHAEYEAVRRHLPRPYQDVLDFAYFSGWRKREILELRWAEVDAAGGVVRLSPARSKTRVGACVTDLGADCGGAVTPTRDASAGRAAGLHAGGHDRAGVASGLASGLSAGRGPRTAPPRLPPDDGAASGPRRGAGTVLTPLYVKTLVQAAWTISWRARESVMTRW